MSLRRADHSSRGVLPSVVCSECDSEARKERSWPGIGSKRHIKNIYQTKRRQISKDWNCRTNGTIRSVEKSVFLTTSATISFQEKTWHHMSLYFTVTNVRFSLCWVLIYFPIKITKMIFNYTIRRFYTWHPTRRIRFEWINSARNWRRHCMSHIAAEKILNLYEIKTLAYIAVKCFYSWSWRQESLY